MGRIYFIKGGKRGGFIKEKADLLRKGGYMSEDGGFSEIKYGYVKKNVSE